MLICSPQNLHDDDDDDNDVLKSQSNSVECSSRPAILHPSSSFLSAPGTALASPSDADRSYADGTDESGSVLSPLRVFPAGRGMVRPGIVPHSSFNSYFRPALLVRRRHPLSPPPLSPRTPGDQTSPSLDQPPAPTHAADLVSPSAHRLYRKRESCTSRWTPSARATPRSPSVSGGKGLAPRRRSVYGHVTAGALPLSLGRRNTVVGGGGVALESAPPPTPLSLREIYRLSRNGSLHSRHSLHARRRSTVSTLRCDKDAAAGVWTSVGLSRCGSGRSQRASVVSCGDADNSTAAAVDVRRRRSGADSIHHHQHMAARSLSSDTDQPPPSPQRDTPVSKTPTFDIILV